MVKILSVIISEMFRSPPLFITFLLVSLSFFLINSPLQEEFVKVMALVEINGELFHG